MTINFNLIPQVRAAVTNPVIGALGDDPDGAQDGSLFNTVLSGIIAFVMIIAVLLVLINLIQAAIIWIGSGGDSSKVEKARDRITQAVIGLIILSASVAIWTFINEFFGLEVGFSPLFQ